MGDPKEVRTYLDATAVGAYVWEHGSNEWLVEVTPAVFGRSGDFPAIPFQGFRLSKDGSVWDGAGGSPIGVMIPDA